MLIIKCKDADFLKLGAKNGVNLLKLGAKNESNILKLGAKNGIKILEYVFFERNNK